MKRKILVADDSASIRRMIDFTLRQTAPVEVFEARNGQEALKTLVVTPMHMLITDLNMPEMDGLELVRHVRSMPGYATMPIIVLTTESQGELKRQAREAGATGWITKPFTPGQIRAVLRLLP